MNAFPLQLVSSLHRSEKDSNKGSVLSVTQRGRRWRKGEESPQLEYENSNQLENDGTEEQAEEKTEEWLIWWDNFLISQSHQLLDNCILCE